MQKDFFFFWDLFTLFDIKIEIELCCYNICIGFLLIRNVWKRETKLDTKTKPSPLAVSCPKSPRHENRCSSLQSTVQTCTRSPTWWFELPLQTIHLITMRILNYLGWLSRFLYHSYHSYLFSIKIILFYNIVAIIL